MLCSLSLQTISFAQHEQILTMIIIRSKKQKSVVFHFVVLSRYLILLYGTIHNLWTAFFVHVCTVINCLVHCMSRFLKTYMSVVRLISRRS